MDRPLTPIPTAGPRRLGLIGTLVLAGLGIALLPAAAGAKTSPPPEPQLDTATATGKVDGLLSNLNVDVQSGPSGENPRGSVSFLTFIEFKGEKVTIEVTGPATCLDVRGNTAVITFLGAERSTWAPAS